MQDARLRLLESGVSVPNPEAWVNRVARTEQAESLRREMFEMEAWFRLHGGHYIGWLNWARQRADAERDRRHARGVQDAVRYTAEERVEAKRGYSRKYNAAKKEERNAYSRAYYEKNKEREKERKRRYYEAKKAAAV